MGGSFGCDWYFHHEELHLDHSNLRMVDNEKFDQLLEEPKPWRDHV
jgi:hypothetical protein